MKKVDFEDIYSFSFISDLAASPDGGHILFSRHRADKASNGYKSYLWLLDTATGETKPLTSGGAERGGRWLDNETVMFTANREGKKGETCYYTISLDGGEGKPLFSIPERVTALQPTSEGKYLGMMVKHCEGAEEEQPEKALDGRDLHVFDEIYFWFNGQGVRNKIRNTLILFDPEKGKYKKITPKYFQTAAYALSPDGTKVAYTGCEYVDRFVMKTGLHLYDITTGKTTTLWKQGGQHAANNPVFVGDDKLFFTLNDGEYAGKNSRYHIFDLKKGEEKELPFVDAEVGGASGTDVNYGGGQNRKYYDGKLYMTRAVWGDSLMYAMDMKSGKDAPVCKTAGSINCFDIAGGTAYMTAMREGALPEIYSLDLKTGAEKRLTDFNQGYMKEHQVSLPEHFTFKNKDGVELDGYVIKPAGYKPGKKYPAVLEIHGGPKTIFGGVFHHEMQTFASHGFFVIYTNPRGSDGRGEKFAYSTKFLGTKDYEDLMEFTDVALARYPDINEKKVGICGGSYGGFMCNWMIGHTDRYAAAASQRSISNYLTKSLTTDIGYAHNMAQLDGDPWTNFDAVWASSPLNSGHKAKTPTLFIQSDEDYRCWMSDAIQMFHALKMNGVDSKICLFHGENHELSRSGKPENRISRLTEICEWFEKYVKKSGK